MREKLAVPLLALPKEKLTKATKKLADAVAASAAGDAIMKAAAGLAKELRKAA